MMAQEYKRRGGDYTTDKNQKDDSQQNLSNWGDEEWQTKEGSGHAKKEDGTEKRYLPKKAWEKMSEKEKEETDQKKQEESKEGKQFVANTSKAKESRKKASKETNGKAEQNGGDEEVEDEEDDGEPDAAAKDDDDEEDFVDDGEADDNEDDEDDQDDVEEEEGLDDGGEEKDEEDEDAQTGDKRKAKNQSDDNSKKQKNNSSNSNHKSNGKTFGSKHMSAEEPAPRGSVSRLPKKGQQIHWKAMPGWVDGEVVEILTQGKNVDGKSVKASKEDPKVVLKSNSSGKICVHKPDACFFED